MTRRETRGSAGRVPRTATGKTSGVNLLLAVSGAVGGLVVFAGGVWALVRGIVRQAVATDANTAAVDRLTGRLDRLEGKLDGQDQRISRLEGWRRGRPR